MPELPEVETVLRGIYPHLIKKRLTDIHIRHHQLRWPIDQNLANYLTKQTLQQIQRRAKYLLFSFKKGTLIIHLGMSGKLTVLNQMSPVKKHDHCDFIFTDKILRYHDPRRFGAILWTAEDPSQHPLLKYLGPEPLTPAFNAPYLFKACQTKTTSIKNIIMDNRIVAGVGNIYANEALFLAKIYPAQPAHLLDKLASQRLVKAIKIILRKAIQAGGTSLKDFLQANGKPGYFKQQLQVYRRHNQPCVRCHKPIILIQYQQRTSYYCGHCQPIYKEDNCSP